MKHIRLITFVAAITNCLLCFAQAQTKDTDVPNKVQSFLRSGCLDGDVDVCMQLGEISLKGEFVYGGTTYTIKPDWVSAFVAWGKACDLGLGNGCYKLAKAMEEGDFPIAKPELITQRYRQGCELDHAGSCYGESKRHSEGLGAPKNKSLALLRMEKACELGNDASVCYIVGLDYEILSLDSQFEASQVLLKRMEGEKNIDSPNDSGMTFRSKAYYYLEKACKLGDKDACSDIEGEKTLDEHISLCNQGDAKSCDALGEIYSSRNLNDETKSFFYYKKACDLGNADGCTTYAASVRYGIGTNRNDTLAFQLFSKACNMGAAKGCGNAAVMVKKGHGTNKNPVVEKEYYAKACSLGEKRYCSR